MEILAIAFALILAGQLSNNSARISRLEQGRDPEPHPAPPPEPARPMTLKDKLYIIGTLILIALHTVAMGYWS